MEPTSSISKMFEIIRDEDAVSSYSTVQLKEILYVLQHEDLSRLCDDDGILLHRFFSGVIRPVANQIDMENVVRLEETLIRELRLRGEVSPAKKFS